MDKKIRAFTLAEMLITVLLISIAMVVMAPVMTKKSKQPPQEIIVNQNNGLPVGAIILWYGEQIPQGWQECSGQNINGDDFKELKENISQYEYLPDLNSVFAGINTNLKWIIKTKK